MDEEPASLLNSSQRKYLRGDIHPDGQRERRIRMDIRDRVIQGFYDFFLLNNELSATDREQLFEKASGGTLSGQPRTNLDYAELSLYGVDIEGKSPHLMDGLRAVFGLIYNGMRDYGYSDKDFAHLVEQSLRLAASEEIDGRVKRAVVDVDIRIMRQWDPEQLYNQWRKGEMLSAKEILRLVTWEGFESEDLERLQTEFDVIRLNER